MKRPVHIEFSWGEAANLLTVAAKANTRGWTPAARGNLKRAIAKLAAACVPVDDPNAYFLVVRGQTPAPRPEARSVDGSTPLSALVPPYGVRRQLRDATLAVGRRRRRS